MKFKLIITVFVLFSQFLFAKSDWVRVCDLGINRVEDMSCSDSNNCFVLVQHTSFTRVYKTTDQGDSWDYIYQTNPNNEPIPYLINAEFAASPISSHYYIAMDEPVIRKSTNGGKTYKMIQLEDLSLLFKSFKMYDENIGFASIYDWYFLTFDGWETFEKYPQPPPGFTSPGMHQSCFLDENTIIMMALIFDTGYQDLVKYEIKEDRWTLMHTFNEDTIKDNIFGIQDIEFINDTLGFVCGGIKTGYYAAKYDVIYRTKDGGHTWEKVLYEFNEPVFGLQEIAFCDEKNGVAVGQAGKIYTTNDGGDTWLNNVLPPEIDINVHTMNVCWAGQTALVVTRPARTVLVDIYEPCNEDCCARALMVCRTSEYEVTITDLGLVTGAENCDSLYFTPGFVSQDPFNPNPVDSIPCYHTCDFLENIEETYEAKQVPETPIEILDILDYEQSENSLYCLINVVFSNTSLKVSIEKTNGSNIVIDMFNINGQPIQKFKNSLNTGKNFFDIDISNISSGFYLYSITINGITLKTGKFHIIR